jgi:ATP:ADP antiporter, AAA family
MANPAPLRGDVASVYAATAASGAMIAQQVAGKAVRDALFLTSFDVRLLPTMMAAAAVLSLLTVLWLSRVITRNAPARVVPVLFAANTAALVLEWLLSFRAPGATAIAVYLHTAVFGPALISSFWSLMNERFDPHTARRAVNRVASGGTLGGVLGSLVAWRGAQLVAVHTMLLVLAGTSAICVVGTAMLRAPTTPLAAKKEAAAETGVAATPVPPSPLQVFRDAPYLRTLSLLVALGAVTSSLLDFVFSAQATAQVGRGPALLSFFGLFWLAVSVLSFLLQSIFGKLALEKLGLAVTVALLPGIVILGGAFGLAVPGLASASLLRGAEAVQRNSLFRSAYELLYTPLPEEKKRATKTIIDVAFDRAGTVLGSGIIFVALRFAAPNASLVLLVIGIAASLLTLARARTLHKGYVGALEESLKLGAIKLDPDDVLDRATRKLMTGKAVAAADAIDPEKVIETLEDGDAAPSQRIAVSAAKDAAVPAEPAIQLRTMLDAIQDLRSGSIERVRAALGRQKPLAPELVPHVLPLLARVDLYTEALHALVPAAGEVTGQLLDVLLSPKADFVLRRRVPRVLSRCSTQRAADGLMMGLGDARFEVRYECGRALLHITDENPAVQISMEAVIAAVKREVALSSDVWESQSDFDEDDDERPTLIDRLLRDRVHRSLEHVFTILSLRLEREPLRLAFKALHQEDESLRGTALEYLENVLPDEVRDAVWPFVGEARPMRKARPATEIFDELLRSGVVRPTLS